MSRGPPLLNGYVLQHLDQLDKLSVAVWTIVIVQVNWLLYESRERECRRYSQVCNQEPKPLADSDSWTRGASYTINLSFSLALCLFLGPCFPDLCVTSPQLLSAFIDLTDVRIVSLYKQISPVHMERIIQMQWIMEFNGMDKYILDWIIIFINLNLRTHRNDLLNTKLIFF